MGHDEEHRTHRGGVLDRVRELLGEGIVEGDSLAEVITDSVERLVDSELERRRNPDAHELRTPALDLVNGHDCREHLDREQVVQVEAAATLVLRQLEQRLQQPDALERAEEARRAFRLEALLFSGLEVCIVALAALPVGLQGLLHRQVLSHLLKERVGSGQLEQHLISITREISNGLDADRARACSDNVALQLWAARQPLEGRSLQLELGCGLLYGVNVRLLHRVTVRINRRKDEDEVEICLPGARERRL